MRTKHDYPIDRVYEAIKPYNTDTAKRPRPGRNEIRVLCPVHNETSPSCDLELDKNIFKCRSCPAGGDCVDMVIKSGTVTGQTDSQKYARAFEWLDNLMNNPRERPTTPLPAPRYYSGTDGEQIIETSREYFPYIDADSRELFQVIRVNGYTADGIKGKTFRQRRRLPAGYWRQMGAFWVYHDLTDTPVPYGPKDSSPIRVEVTDAGEPSGKWIYTTRGQPLVLQHLPKVIACAQSGGTLHIAEGERKTASIIRRTGWTATKPPGGANAPLDPINLTYVQGIRHLIIWEDDDIAGREGALLHAAAFRGIIPKITIARIYNTDSKRDIDDWLTDHPAKRAETIEQLTEYIEHGIDVSHRSEISP